MTVVQLWKDIALKHGWDDIVQVLVRLQEYMCSSFYIFRRIFGFPLYAGGIVGSDV